MPYGPDRSADGGFAILPSASLTNSNLNRRSVNAGVIQTVFMRFKIATLLLATLALAIAFSVGTWWFDLPHSDVESVPSLHGMTAPAIISQLGEPDEKYQFTMDECGDEFRVTLFNTYPPGLANLSSIEIQEWTWRYSRHRLTVWLHKPNEAWVVLDSCRYKNGVMF